jgi:hypothetical protein
MFLGYGAALAHMLTLGTAAEECDWFARMLCIEGMCSSDVQSRSATQNR